MRRTHCLFFALSVVVAGCVCASPARGGEFDELRSEFMAAQQAWGEKLQAQPHTESGALDATQMPPHPAKEFLAKFRACAEKHADTLQGMKAMAMVIQCAGVGDMTPGKANEDADWALGALEKGHAAKPEIKEVIGELRWAAYTFGKPRLVRFMETVIAANRDREVLAQATFSLGATLYQPMDMSDIVPATTKPDGSARKAEVKRATDLFRKVVADYGDSDAAKEAKGYIFEIERLQPGMKAPEIVGKDENDKEIRLSQFHGQVVMLDFWGFW